MVNLFNSVLEATPSDATGLTALALWILVCILFVLAALLFFLLMLGIQRRRKETKGVVAFNEEFQVREDRSDKIFLTLHVMAFLVFVIIYFIAIAVS